MLSVTYIIYRTLQSMSYIRIYVVYIMQCSVYTLQKKCVYIYIYIFKRKFR